MAWQLAVPGTQTVTVTNAPLTYPTGAPPEPRGRIDDDGHDVRAVRRGDGIVPGVRAASPQPAAAINGQH